MSDARTMTRLAWWMRIVGAFYLVLGAGFFPPVNQARLSFMIPGFDATPESIAYKAFIDWTLVFGLDLLVIGAVLLYAAREPLRNRILVWLVVWLEGVRGVLDDLYYISRGYASAPFYIGFIAVHLVIISTGVLLVRRASSAAAAS